jgi:hypothetical protein
LERPDPEDYHLMKSLMKPALQELPEAGIAKVIGMQPDASNPRFKAGCGE